MTLYFLLKTAHGLLAAVLLGTALAGLFFALRAWKSGELRQLAATFSSLVRLEIWFIGSSAVLLPLSGLALAKVGGWPLGQLWLLWSVGLYLLAALCWLPLLWLQVRIRNLARRALRDGEPIASQVAGHVALRCWLAVVALVLLVAVYVLMVVKPL
ncbi:DUF2269 domain-containing protein [Pseudomonas sp. BN415]|uniref:DUF2269 domain-containing protein n=1 Tax=Pseudomonas sp. BN415 TaxID=2567889 RepID=UPI00245885D0|nr:DUF2269 domain-containing protein [Pseudomonas sp. BN415]MDH4582341.1 DUF2269 domain-containing protein [Pseudomonas sp. BN415]